MPLYAVNLTSFLGFYPSGEILLIDDRYCEIQCRLCFVWEFTYFPRGYLKFFVVLVGLAFVFKNQINSIATSIYTSIREQVGNF